MCFICIGIFWNFFFSSRHYSSPHLSVGNMLQRPPVEAGSHGEYWTLYILFFPIHIYWFFFFGISKLPVSLLLWLGPLLSKIRLLKHKHWETTVNLITETKWLRVSRVHNMNTLDTGSFTSGAGQFRTVWDFIMLRRMVHNF